MLECRGQCPARIIRRSAESSLSGSRVQLSLSGSAPPGSSAVLRPSAPSRSSRRVLEPPDPGSLQTLELLRSNMPMKAQLNTICRGCKAWVGAEPSTADARPIQIHFRGCHKTRRRLALETLHPHEAPLATLPGKYEDNSDNQQGSKLREIDSRGRLMSLSTWAPASI